MLGPCVYLLIYSFATERTVGLDPKRLHGSVCVKLPLPCAATVAVGEQSGSHYTFLYAREEDVILSLAIDSSF